MKLLRLRLKNLNSIRDEVSVDFENGALSETSLFAITGATGAGKTTILDAISVALYHKTPRLAGSSAKNPENLLRQGCKEGFSEVLFESNGKRYLAEWHVKRSKSDNLSSSVKLIEADTEKLLNDKKTRNPVEQILGLDFPAFRRSVLLAQGEFAAFLKAGYDDKRKVIEKTTGIGIYDDLRELLNKKFGEVRVKFENLKAILENTPKSNEEQIKATEKQLADVTKALKQLQAERAEILKKRELETKRDNNWQQLKNSEEQRAQLESRKSEMSAIEKEINKAQLAAELLTPQNAFDLERKNLEEGGQALEKAGGNFNQSQENLKQFKTELEAKETAFEQAKELSAEKFELINSASQEEIKAANIKAEAQKRFHELETLKNEIEAVVKLLKETNAVKNQIDRQISQKQQFLSGAVLPANHTRLLAQLNQDIAILGESRNKLTEIENEGKTRRTILDQTKIKLKEFQDQKSRLTQKRDGIFQQNEDILKELQPVLSEGEESDWEKRRQPAQSLQEVALAYENFMRQMTNLLAQQKEIQAVSQSTATQIKRLDCQIAEYKNELLLIEKNLVQLKADERNIALSKHVFEIRKEQLETGQPCPVCGALEHPWAGKTELETEELARNINEKLSVIEEEFKDKQAAFQKVENEKSALVAAHQEQKKRIAEIQQEVDNLKSETDRCNAEWNQVFPDKPVSHQFIKMEIELCESKIKKLQELNTQQKNIENDLIRLDAQLSNKQTEADHAGRELEKLSKERNELILQYKELKLKIDTISSQVREQLPQEFQQHAPEKAIELLQERIEQHGRTEKELAQLKQDLGKIQTLISENEKKSDQTQKRHDNLRAEIDEYQQAAKKLLSQAAEKTGGLSAQAARIKLEQELLELENRKNSSKKQFQAAKDRVTETETSLREISQRHEKNKERFENAKAAYLNAVKNAGFESIETHQAAIRSADWLKQNREMLREFQQRLFSIEQEIKRLSKEFEEAPFDPELLKAIQAQENEVEKSVQELNTQIGTINEKLTQQKSNFESYKKREHDFKEATSEYERWHKLNELIGSNKLRDYALKSMFDLLIRFANHQMKKLTNRYVLKVKDMKDMVVIDTWNAGEERPVETLSGGESFLTSLALALALSELSKGRAQLGALFLDEGFGSLDQETLEIALDALESLRLAGRRVGIISHVQELTRRIPVRIAVKKRGDGSSTIEVEGSI